MSSTRSGEAEFETALILSLNRAGAVTIPQFRVPGTSTWLDIYVASPARAFVEIKLQNSLPPRDLKRLLIQTAEIHRLFGGEVVPIIVTGDRSLEPLSNDKLKAAGILVIAADFSQPVDVSADRCAATIWDFLTHLPYQFKGELPSARPVRMAPPRPMASPPRHISKEEIVSRLESFGITGRALASRAAMDQREEPEQRSSPIDIFDDVLVSLKFILTLEQFTVLSHELAAFSEEYLHAHYTACGLRVGRTLEHVVYALARAWGVSVNRTALQVLSDLDNAFEQLSRTVVEYVGSEENEKRQLKKKLQDGCQLVSNKLLRLVFDVDTMIPKESNVPINVESIVRDIKKRFAAREQVRTAIENVMRTDLIRKILDIRNIAAHAHTAGARRELSQNEVDEAVELLRTALFLFSNVAFAVAERGASPR